MVSGVFSAAQKKIQLASKELLAETGFDTETGFDFFFKPAHCWTFPACFENAAAPVAIPGKTAARATNAESDRRWDRNETREADRAAARALGWPDQPLPDIVLVSK